MRAGKVRDRADRRFWGRETAACRQIGNAVPPPVARAVGARIRSALLAAREQGAGPAPAPPASGVAPLRQPRPV